MTKNIVASVFMSVALLAASITASATPIRYALDKVTFTDGTSATGFITFDSDTKKSSAYDIFTSPGILSAFEWTPSNSGLYYGGGAGPNNFTIITTNGRRAFNFSFANALTNAGGDNLLNISSTYECDNCSPYRRVNGGSLTSLAVTAVPEPATPALLLAAAGMFAFLQRRRKQTQA